MTILSAIVMLGILIFVHELGHFIFAKIMGVGVLKFSLGFGPKIVGRKIGETEYMISADLCRPPRRVCEDDRGRYR